MSHLRKRDLLCLLVFRAIMVVQAGDAHSCIAAVFQWFECNCGTVTSILSCLSVFVVQKFCSL